VNKLNIKQLTRQNLS